MTWKKRILAISLVLILFLTACESDNVDEDVKENNNGDNIVEVEPRQGGQVIIPLTNFTSLNPLLVTNSNYYHFSKLIFEGLFEFDADLSLAPKLAEDYFVFNQGRTVSIELKDKISWHDGTLLTSEDVAFTIDVIKYANRDSTYGNIIADNLGIGDIVNLNSIISTSIVDEKIIEITFDKVYLNNLEVLTFPIIPKHVFQHDGSDRNTIINALIGDDYRPVGTGPFRFVSYEKQKQVNLVKNENYWNGRPYIDEIIGKVLDDEELILTSFETGQISFSSTMGVDWDKYKNNNRIEVLEYVSPNYEFLGFNFNNEAMLGKNGQAIRKAIAYGINRQDIIHKNYLGHASQVDLPLHPNSYLLAPGINMYGYNKDKAIEILNNAGYRHMDDDNILEDQDGNKLSLRLITNPNNPSRRYASQLIKDYLADIGIEIILDFDTQDIKEYEDGEEDLIWEQFTTRVNRGDYDIVLMGWQSSLIANLYPMYHSSMISSETNFINYNDEVMDQLLLDTLLDKSREDKQGVYEHLQEKIIEDLPYVSLYFTNKGLLVDTKIHGDLNPTFFNLYKGIENCYVVE